MANPRVEVRGCYDCPMETDSFCQHPETKGDPNIPEVFSKVPDQTPPWCPLRFAPLILWKAAPKTR